MVLHHYHPINCVDWKQARTFAQWVGGDLPTDAQWEYASRSAGKDWEYPWGNAKATCEYAVMSYGCGKGGTWPVCSKKKGNTEQGLCDMAGGVWEWMRDEYKSYDSSSRMVRGGSWRNNAWYLRSANRDYNSPSYRVNYLGFRLQL
jgi:formylglycine-generating enzyme